MAPSPEFGLVHPRLVPRRGGLLTSEGSTVLQLSADAPLTVDGSTAVAELVLREGDELTLALQQVGAWEPAPPLWKPRQVRRRIEETIRAWCCRA